MSGRGARLLAAVVSTIVLVTAACSTSQPDAAPEPNREPLATETGPIPSPAPGSRADGAAGPTPTGPNLVVIMTDDQAASTMSYLPATNAVLGERGVVFDESFVSYPVCCPSRASFLSGRYASNHGVMWNSGPVGGYRRFRGDAAVLPLTLLRGGYRTIHIGKYLNGYGWRDHTEIPAGWSDWQGLVDPSTGQYYGYTINDNGRLVTAGMNEDDYQTDVLAARAEVVIEREAAIDGPFFLNLAFLAPHGEFGAPLDSDEEGDGEEGPLDNGEAVPLAVAAERHRGRFAEEPLPQPPSFNGDLSGKPPMFASRRPISPQMQDQITTAYRTELESLLAVDEAVVRVVDALERTGQADDTLIVFTSDNGYFHGEHRLPFGKFFPYEPSIRVPLVVSGPGVEPHHSRSIVANIDLAPTLLDVAGLDPLEEMDGVSLVPLFTTDAPDWRRAVLLEGQPPDGPRRQPYRGVRAPGLMFASYEDGAVELYDLQTDPHQLTNRVDDPRYAETRADLERTLRTLQACAGRSCDVFG
jgi:N-acetylglucosamine-6-sulfatase